MVNSKNVKRFALISVYDKSKIRLLCNSLTKHRIDLISTGSTAKKIKSLGFSCKEVSNITKFKEILDGRVKTLHPKIHASVLFNRKNKSHVNTFNKLHFPKIDFVIINLYPFKKTLTKTSKKDKIIEMIDIGGSALLRSSSKNFDSVTTVCDTKYYSSFIGNLKKNNGFTSLLFRKKMAANAFKSTYKYDKLIYNWLNNKYEIKKSNKIKLKYGENLNQISYFIKSTKKNILNSQLHGKKIGYNNILDISDGLNCLREFKEPTCVIIKHNNPCGVASGANIYKAFLKAYNCDSKSAFGGIVLLNRGISFSFSELLHKYFFEIIVGPNFTNKALELLKTKKSMILLNSKHLHINTKMSYRSVNSGILVQSINKDIINKKNLKLVSVKSSSETVKDDLVFAYKVAKHVKSNAIVIVKNKQTLGVGAGQMSRYDATRIALMKYNDFFNKKKIVCASDAFFPFTDSIKLLKKNNCIALIQPSGSINDKKIIEYANKQGIQLYFAPNRVFKH